MKLRIAKHSLIFQARMILLLSLSLCGVVRAETTTAQQAEANAIITAFSMEAFKSNLPASDFAAWPVPLRDSLIYSLNRRPSADWSPELRQFVLAKFRQHTTDLGTYSQPIGQFKTWMQLSDPFKDTTLLFNLDPVMGISSESEFFRAVMTFPISYNTDENVQSLSLFLVSLTAKQKADLFAAHGRLPLSEFTGQQKASLKLAMRGDRDYGSRNGIPYHSFEQKDAIVTVRISIHVFVYDLKPGTPPNDFYATRIADSWD